MERLHPFDSRKFGKVIASLQKEGFFSEHQVPEFSLGGSTGYVSTSLSSFMQLDSRDGELMYVAVPEHPLRFHAQLVEPKEATQEMLLDVHSQGYLDRLNASSAEIASVHAASLNPSIL